MSEPNQITELEFVPLRQFVRAVMAAIPDEHGPRQIAEVVADVTPHEDLYAYYIDSLVPLVREIMQTDRSAATRPLRKRGHKTTAASTKIVGIRNAQYTRLMTAVYTVDNHGTRKLFSDCTAEDIDFIIEERRALANIYLVQVRQYSHIRELLVTHSVKTVGDLPPEEVLAA